MGPILSCVFLFSVVVISYFVGRWHAGRLWMKILDAAHSHWFAQLNFLIGADMQETLPPGDDGRCPDCGNYHDSQEEQQSGGDPEAN